MTKYLAIDPDGAQATRTTQNRTYTHAVFVRHSKERAIFWANKRDPHNDSNFWHHMSYINGTSKYLDKKQWESVEQWAERVVLEKAWSREALAGCTGPDEWFEMNRQQALAKIEAKDWSVWDCVAWCGRYDLALKRKAFWGSKDGIEGCEIVEVETR